MRPCNMPREAMVAALLLATGCGLERRETGQTASPIPLESLLVELADVPLQPDESDPIGYAIDLAVSSRGAFIVDRQQANIKYFSRDGKLIRTLGRAGNGPGEFRRPYGAALLSNERLAVLDRGRGVISVWDSGGTWLEEWRVEGDAWDLDAAEGGNAIAVSGFLNVGDSVSGTLRRVRLRVHQPTGEIRNSFGTVPEPKHRYERIFGGMDLATVGAVLVSGQQFTNLITYTDARTGREWTHPIGGTWYKPIEFPPDDGRPFDQAGLQRLNEWSRQQLLMMRLIGFGDELYLARFDTYDQERVRVRFYVLADLQGRTRAIMGPSYVDFLAVRRDTLFGVTTDDDGNVSLKIMRPKRRL
ncbi:hypothetical protein HRbin33_02040 [bacterium HR33]|nr:hypothetical protein HRbin33_02040 [bacterium HR33]